uniref:Putative secreted histamine binding protein n=1 Tax=Ixodes scapularis TaxID=6945 RepID=Q8MVC3_IXOSC|nr:putative secreted histamine binding protein [Ixodes scapularis]
MGLMYAALFACIASASAWQAQMTIRNPENNPLLNEPSLGPLQSAWKAINKSKDDPFVLMFRSRNHEPNITCVVVTASLHNETLKIVNFTRTYYNETDGKNDTLEYQVRALNQTDYKLENVIRAGLKGTPSDKPTPLGSNMYIEYGDYSCNTSSKPLTDMLKAAKDAVGSEAGSAEPVEGVNYLDFYVVHNQPHCNILRSPLLKGGCDFWLRKSELPAVLERAENITKSIPSKVEDTQAEEKSETAIQREDITKEKTHKFQEALFRSLPTACRYAFISACGYPNDMMYDKSICKNTQTEETSPISKS